MPAPVVVGSTVAISLIFVLQMIGFGTPNWYHLWFGSTLVHAGIFAVCTRSICWNYFVFLGYLSIHYLGFAGLQALGTILLFCAMVVAAVGLCNKAKIEKRLMGRLAGLLFSSAGCLISSIVWFSVAFYNSATEMWSALSSYIRIELGYSFYMVTISAALVLIMAIACCVIGQNMAPPPTVVQAPQAVGQTTLVVMTGNQQMAPQPPPQQYPYGQPMYGNQGYNYPAVVVPNPGYNGATVSYIQPQDPVYQPIPMESKQM